VSADDAPSRLHDVPTTFDMMALPRHSQPATTSQMVSAALQCWLADRWMMVAVLSGTRNSANYHSQPVDRVRPARSRSSARLAVSLRDHIGGGPRVANAFSTRLTSDATRESLKCMATQLVNNERKKNCRRSSLQDNVIELSYGSLALASILCLGI